MIQLVEKQRSIQNNKKRFNRSPQISSQKLIAQAKPQPKSQPYKTPQQ